MSTDWKAALASRLLALHDHGLGRKAGFVFILIFLLAAINILVVRAALAHADSVAATVNVAGKMRMISQRLAYGTLQSWQQGGAADPQIAQDIAGFDQAYAALEQGGQVFGMAVRPVGAELAPQLGRVRQLWQQYRDGALAAQLGPTGATPAQRQALQLQSRAVLQAADNLLQDMVAVEAEYRSHQFAVLYTMFALDLLLLLVASLAVQRYVLRPLRMLSNYCGELVEGNYDARVDYPPRDEIGQLARALNASAERTHALMAHIQQEHQKLLRAEALFQGVAENTAVGVIVVLNDMTLRYANGVYARMVGQDGVIPSIYETQVSEAFIPRDRQRITALLEAYLDGRITSERGHRSQLQGPTGEGMPVELFCSAMQLGKERAVVVLLLDITDRREAEVAAREASLVFQSTSDAIVVTDHQGYVINVNPAFSVITGYSREEMIGANMRVLSSGRQDRAFYEALWESLRVRGSWSGDLWNRRKDGQDYAEHLSINAVYDSDGSVRCFVGIFTDITQQKRAEDTIWRQAHYDGLTGLPNRQYFHVRIQDALERARNSVRNSVALVFLDLDLFKEVNDTLGHEVGDDLLRAVGERLSGSLRESDTVARLGGDEFTVILEGISDTGAVDRILRNMLDSLSRPYTLRGHEITISASVGVTFFPQDGTDAGELLRNADLAMYAAKEGGRNQFRRFEPSMREAALTRRQMQRDLLVALAERQFQLLYQPIIDLRTGRLAKVEALLRWNHPARGMLSPLTFIAHAEETGLIREIGEWVFREATLQLCHWHRAQAAGIQVSINVSPVQLLADGIRTDDWLAHLSELGLPAEALTVEITESLLMDMGPATQDKLLAFRDAGVQVALDDFGTGYSSLSYLNRFDIDYIKIDRSFVKDLEEGSESLALCQAIIVMAHKLGLRVVAEGVSTERQSELLQQSGCDYAQGYLFSQPLAAGEIEALLSREFVVPAGA